MERRPRQRTILGAMSISPAFGLWNDWDCNDCPHILSVRLRGWSIVGCQLPASPRHNVSCCCSLAHGTEVVTLRWVQWERACFRAQVCRLLDYLRFQHFDVLVIAMPGQCQSFAAFCLRDSLSLSLSSLRRILPLGLLGIGSMNSTPPLSHLWRALLFSTCLWISRITILSVSSKPTVFALTT